MACDSTVRVRSLNPPPSPWATQTPRDVPAMPLSKTAGDSRMVTELKRASKRPEELWMNRGCLAMSRYGLVSSPEPGTHPSSAMSWQPLQTPSEKESLRR